MIEKLNLLRTFLDSQDDESVPALDEYNLKLIEEKLNELIDAVNELKEDIKIVKMENRVHKKKIDFIMENTVTGEIKEETADTTTFKTLKELYEK